MQIMMKMDDTVLRLQRKGMVSYYEQNKKTQNAKTTLITIFS